MNFWQMLPTDALWRGALSAIPVALLVAAVCRFLPCRHATRHTLWLLVLLWFVVAPFLPAPPLAGSLSFSESILIANTTDPIPEPATDSAVSPIATARERAAALDTTSKRTAIGSRRSAARHRAGGSEHQPAWLAHVDHPDGPPLPFSHSPVAPCEEQAALALTPIPSMTHWLIDQASHVDVASSAAMTVERSDTIRWLSEEPVPKADDWRPESTSVWSKRPEPLATEVSSAVASAVARDAPSPDRPEHDVAQAETDRSAASVKPVGGAPEKDAWALWVAGLRIVRDAVGMLPPVPAGFWLAGLAMFVLSKCIGLLRCRRLLRTGRRPTGETLRLVGEMADRLGLRGVPTVKMVDAPVTPMVWVGSESCLVLPSGLWAQLDSVGRKVVVCHELAHLKRRDHWIYWVQIVVTGLYWWNPVVHWVRTRLSAEAEYCCDAWVTWLMPTERRAYAETLIRTKQFVNTRPSPQLVGGVGILSGRARRFARRLTMVMTESTTPRHSLLGGMLAVTIMAAGWLVTPVFACPKGGKVATTVSSSSGCSKVNAEASATACARCKSGNGQRVECCKASGRGECKGCRGSARKGRTSEAKRTFERYVADKADGLAPIVMLTGTGEDDTRIARLERQLERLAEQLERLTDRLGDGHAKKKEKRARGKKREVRRQRESRTSREHSEHSEHSKHSKHGGHGEHAAHWEPREPRAPRSPREPRGVFVPRPGAAPQAFAAPFAGKRITKAYRLPEGKLKGLTALMVRSDVPIVVRSGDGALEVIATEAQHATFGGFVSLLEPTEEHVRAYRLSEGKLEALASLMARDDVPTWIEMEGDEITVHGDATVQAVFDAFVRMIGGDTSISFMAPSRDESEGAFLKEMRRAEHEALVAYQAAEQVARQQMRHAEQEARAVQKQVEQEARAAFREAKELVRKERKAKLKAKKKAKARKKKHHEPDQDAKADVAPTVHIAGVDVRQLIDAASSMIDGDEINELIKAAKLIGNTKDADGQKTQTESLLCSGG